MTRISHFLASESGAVTVDMVVLMSAVVGLGLAIMLSVGNSTAGLAKEVAGTVDGLDVWTFAGSGTPSSGTSTGETTSEPSVSNWSDHDD